MSFEMPPLLLRTPQANGSEQLAITFKPSRLSGSVVLDNPEIRQIIQDIENSAKMKLPVPEYLWINRAGTRAYIEFPITVVSKQNGNYLEIHQ